MYCVHGIDAVRKSRRHTTCGRIHPLHRHLDHQPVHTGVRRTRSLAPCPPMHQREIWAPMPLSHADVTPRSDEAPWRQAVQKRFFRAPCLPLQESDQFPVSGCDVEARRPVRSSDATGNGG